MRTRPSLQADGHGVCGPSAVATAGYVRGNPPVVGDTRASTGDVGVASGVGSLVGWPGNQDRWPFCALPLRFSGPLAGLVRTETLSLGTGIRHKETPAMDTAHLAVHGFLLREAVFSQSGFDRKNKNHNQSRCGRKYTCGNERSGEEKLRGQFSERCPWFTFSPAVL